MPSSYPQLLCCWFGLVSGPYSRTLFSKVSNLRVPCLYVRYFGGVLAPCNHDLVRHEIVPPVVELDGRMGVRGRNVRDWVRQQRKENGEE